MSLSPDKFDNVAIKKLNVSDSFSIAGTAVTATAAEINAIASSGISAADAAKLGSTSGYLVEA